MLNTFMITFTPINIEERKKVDIRPGDTVRVWQKIEEKGKTRLQAFEGLVIARKHGSELGATFTVRKIASGVGVEKIFPLYSPVIDKIEIVRRAKVRRAKLYYIREKTAKQIRRKMKSLAGFVPVVVGGADSQTNTEQAQTVPKTEDGTEEKAQTPEVVEKEIEKDATEEEKKE